MPKNSAPPAKAKKKLKLKHELLYFCSCCAGILVLILSILNLRGLNSSGRVLGLRTEVPRQELARISEEITFWKKFLGDNPSYFDGWLELAVLERQTGDEMAAQAALNAAQQIDPNSRELKILQENL
jgi:tetratricopeptide (TPR) repeat protein